MGKTVDSNVQNFIVALGALPEKTDVRDYKLKAAAMPEEFPETYEVPYLVKVKNQGAVGSCVAHALAETVEYHNKIQEGNTKAVSTGFIYGNRRNSLSKDSGMYVREALQNMCKYGDVFKTEFNENVEVPKAIELFEKRFETLKDQAYPNRFSTYFRVASDADIKYALMNYGPVVFAMPWYSDIKVNADGIMTTKQNKDDVTGGHCMIIYGWNKDGWLIQNSWGTAWGKSGRAILPYNVKKSEAWGVTDEVSGENPDIVKPVFNETILRWLGKVINAIVNFFKSLKK